MFITGCGDDTIIQFESITEEINNGRPYDTITIRRDGIVNNFGENGLQFSDAFAEDGFLTIIRRVGDPQIPGENKLIFNLTTTKEIFIGQRTLRITY
jgi:hypothetical protein